MTLHSLPLFVRLAGRPVILVGEGEAAAAKRRLLERAGALVVGEEADAVLAIVALEAEAEATAAAERLRRRGVLVNAVDRPESCDFTLPAIIDRSPVIVAIGTGGVSAGLAAALRQRLEGWLSPELGRLALFLQKERAALRRAFPDAGERRRAIAQALAPGGNLDLAVPDIPADATWAAGAQDGRAGRVRTIRLASADPDDLTLRQARWLANADHVCHTLDVPAAILDRARADATRIVSATMPVMTGPGLTIFVEMTE